MNGTVTLARHSSESNEHYTPAPIVEAARRTMGSIDLDPASCARANETVKAACFFDVEANGFRRSWHARREGDHVALSRPSNVFLNPPGGWCDTAGRRVIKASKTTPSCTVSGACGLPPGHEHDACDSSAKEWWWRLQEQLYDGVVAQAVFIAFSVEMLQTTQIDIPRHHGAELLPMLVFPLCFPARRVSYLKPDSERVIVGASPPHSTVIAYMGPNRAAFAREFAPFGRIK